tara:strand:+ start:943 stop:1167 length:225 start_codon:yes stop_codon:yes gene_type:complete
MPKQKKKKVIVKPLVNPTEFHADHPLQLNLPKAVADEKKINPKKVFEGYTAPKKQKTKKKTPVKLPKGSKGRHR